MYYIYVLQNEQGQGYIGYTADLRRRFQEHQHGQSISTKGHIWRIVYYEAYASEADARHREAMLKLRSRAYAQLRARLHGSLKQDNS